MAFIFTLGNLEVAKVEMAIKTITFVSCAPWPLAHRATGDITVFFFAKVKQKLNLIGL
ncbi:MAG: hypothetical protein LBE38_11385 [Deltaproteobacteria bacterium]|jgi:hypothetical protein|nr:hypothetical protein [Deltaproteobacteria bacterium]